MYDEHCTSIDSDLIFVASNYGTHTTSHIEYYYVADPTNGLAILGLDDWPRPSNRGSNGVDRIPHPPEAFEVPWQKVNQALSDLNEQPLDMAGFVGLRLYTGPMYVKYNTILRAKSGLVPALSARAQEMCRDNSYPSTFQVRPCAPGQV